MINPAERETAKAKFNKQELPAKEYDWYVVYKYTFSSWCIFDASTEEAAHALAADYKAKKDCTYAGESAGYPYEVAIKWKEEDEDKKKKKKDKPE